MSCVYLYVQSIMNKVIYFVIHIMITYLFRCFLQKKTWPALHVSRAVYQLMETEKLRTNISFGFACYLFIGVVQCYFCVICVFYSVCSDDAGADERLISASTWWSYSSCALQRALRRSRALHAVHKPGPLHLLQQKHHQRMRQVLEETASELL